MEKYSFIIIIFYINLPVYSTLCFHKIQTMIILIDENQTVRRITVMNKKLYKLMNWPKIEAVEYLEESNPFEILAPKQVGTSTLFQMFYPGAVKVDLLISSSKENKVFPMEEKKTIRIRI